MPDETMTRAMTETPTGGGADAARTLRPLVADPKSGWDAKPLLRTNEASWLETGNIESGNVRKDDNDIPGPLNIGMTLTRDAKGVDGKSHTQRVVLIGDADFLANAYVSQLGNQQLGLNIVQWLASRDAQLNIDIPKAPDTSLYLPGWAVFVLAGGFVVVLPLGLIGFGVARWIIRRRK